MTLEPHQTITGQFEDATEEPGQSESLSARAFASDGEEIHSPSCTWTLDAGDGPVTLLAENRSSISVESDAEGSATVTCTIGEASGSGTITYRTPPPGS